MSLILKPNLQICALGTYSLCRKEPILDLQHTFQSRFCEHKLWFSSSSSAGGEPSTTASDSKVPGTKKHPRRNLVLSCLPQDHAHSHQGSSALPWLSQIYKAALASYLLTPGTSLHSQETAQNVLSLSLDLRI